MRYLHSFRSFPTVSPAAGAAASNDNVTVQLLGYWTCFFVDIPNDKSPARFMSPYSKSTEYSCIFRTTYLTGASAGPSICLIIATLISIIGVVGLVGNVTNVIVLRHSTKGSTLQNLLVVLAGFDLLGCLFAVLSCIFLDVILCDVNRSKGVMIAFKVVFLLYSLGRTGSNWITILITAERYFVVVHNFRAKSFLTARRSQIILGVWLVLIFLINFPWWINSKAVSTYRQNETAVGPLAKYPAFFVPTSFGENVYPYLRTVHIFVDFVLPLPLLLLFNGLMYKYIYDWNKKRVVLTGSHVREVNAATMFSIVVVVLLTCHSFAVVNYFVTRSTSIVYRELILTIILAVTLNASINCFVYYAFGQDYREYFWLLIGSKFRRDYSSKIRLEDRNLLNGRSSPGAEGDIIRHESVRYVSYPQREGQNEQSRLLNE